MKITFVGFSGGSCSTLSQPVEILNLAAARAVKAGTLETEPKVHVTTSNGKPLERIGFFSVSPTITLAEIPDSDVIYLSAMDPDFSEIEVRHQEVLDWIRAANARGALIAAVCPSQAILARAGLLDGKTSAAHWSLIDSFRANWPAVDWRVDDMVVEEGNILTCCGTSSSVDLALFLVFRLFGEDIMMECVRWFQTDTPRIRHAMPPPVFEMPGTSDDRMAEVQTWMHGHFTEAITVEETAAKFGMSPRSFYRRFRASFGDTPRVYLQKIRVAAARRLLETKTDAVETIGRQVGYEDPIFFRKIFKREVTMTPGAYRKKFGFKAL